jgi:hypothetical protein
MTLILISLLSAADALAPFTGCYWEVWQQHLTTDYAASVSTIPISPPLAGNSARRVGIAFADYGFSTDSEGSLLIRYLNEQVTSNWSTFGFDRLSSSISSVNNRGGRASITFGGAIFSWKSSITTSAQASTFSSNVVTLASAHGIDSVEFSHVDPGASPTIFKNFVDGIKTLSPSIEITYTIPGKSPFLSPWRDALTDNKDNLSFVQIMAYDTYSLFYTLQTDIDELVNLGIAKSKIIIGILPGCHDEPFNFTSADDISNIASLVKRQGLAGIFMWSCNRDTNHRSSDSSCLFQTGLPDAFFLSLTSSKLET